MDAIIAQDPNCRVACETLVKTGMVLIAGEIRTNKWVDIEDIARGVIKDIGYNHSDMGFDYESCAVMSAIGKQSVDIARGVDEATNQTRELGAGDQGFDVWLCHQYNGCFNASTDYLCASFDEASV